MKLTTLMAAVAATLAIAQNAEAREQHYRHGAYTQVRHYAYAHRDSAPRYFNSASSEFGYGTSATSANATVHGGRGGRPAAWCGWAMRQLVGGDPGPEYNLARNWARWGHAGPPGIGAVVVWPHHVGKIVGQENGKWIVQSGNDGGSQMRTRPRSISGAIAFRWS
jgi:hypothetical protein